MKTVHSITTLLSSKTFHGGCFFRSYASRVIVKEPLTTSLWRTWRDSFRAKTSMKDPPYDHVCQIGDPVLRGEAAEVDVKAIPSKEIQDLIKTMIKVMRKQEAVGIAAPQIGVPKQIFAMEYTQKHDNRWTPEIRQQRETMMFPLKIFINPKLKILDAKKISIPEGCLSIVGFHAHVPRNYEVEVSGFDEKGKHHSWQVKGYPAKIIQHEYDHLHGTLYVDKMDSKTFVDDDWMRWNLK